MYVRDAKNRDEAWLLGEIESMGLDEEAFRSRDYVLAVDEQSNERVGFGRLRVHSAEPDVCELTGIGVREVWRDQGVGAHVIERLLAEAGDAGFETVYVVTDQPGYLDQFGFSEIDRSELPEPLGDRFERKADRLAGDVAARAIDTDGFEMPPRLREAFKHAAADDDSDEEPPETAADFGIDTESATYKYDTGS